MTTDLQEIVRCTTDQPPPEFWVSVEDAKRLTDELRRLEAIVDKLPKTADGVRIILGETELYWRPPDYLDAQPCHLGKCICITIGTELGRCWVFGQTGSKQLLENCYSTREAAEAAKEKNPHGD